MANNIIIFCILSIINLPLFAQSKGLRQTTYNGEKYWVYPALQDTTYLNTSFKEWYNYDLNSKYVGSTDTFPENGKWVGYFLQDTSRIAFILAVDSGFIRTSIVYDFAGFKACEYEFRHGEQHGFSRYWNQAGLLTLEHQYRNGSPYGQWKTLFSNGQIRSIANYNAAGYKDNIQSTYFEDGKKATEDFYSNGVREGISTVWHTTGKVKYSLIYKSDTCVANPAHKIFYDNGAIAAAGNIVHGNKIGVWLFFYPNGKIKAKGHYGSYVYHHEHGDMLFPVRIDSWEFWHANGQLLARGDYVSEADIELNNLPPIPVRKPNWIFYDANGQETNEAYLLERNINLEKGFVEDVPDSD